MTLAMPDSIYPDRLPPGYGQYLGYADGEWATAPDLARLFPHARRVILTVTGGTLEADGCDCEKGDLPPASAADWAQRKLAAAPDSRPVLYASPEAPGYRMIQVLDELGARGIRRSQVRLLSAHYGAGQHICGPATCRLVPVPMDGTQWTDAFAGVGGFPVDMSDLEGGFFGVPGNWEDALLTVIATVRKGSTGQAVSNWQGLLAAHGYDLGTSGPRKDGIDGVFGAVTDAATRAFQKAKGIGVDGIAGRVTYTAALT